MQWRVALVGVLMAAAACASPADDPATPSTVAPPPSTVATGDTVAIPRCIDLETPPEVDGPLSDDPDIAAAQVDRASLGLASDIASVEELFAAGELESGFPASFDELLALEARGNVDVDAINQYGFRFPGQFGGLWLDNARGVVTVAFTDDIDVHEAAIAELAPDDAVVEVVQVEHSYAELVAITDQINALAAELGIEGGGIRTPLNRVSLFLGYIDPDEVQAVSELFDPEMVCIEGTDEPPAPEGPQPTEGDGWRLLADQTVGIPYYVSAATGQAGLDRMWSRFEFSGDVPVVDFENEFVVLFTAAVSGSCPQIRLDDVVTDAQLVYGVFSHPGVEGACTSDANPHSYVVAVERGAIEGDVVTISLEAEDACGGCEDDIRTVDLADPTLDAQLWGGGRILVVRTGQGLSDFPAVTSVTVTGVGTAPEERLYDNVPELGDPLLLFWIEPAVGSYTLEAWEASCAADGCGDFGDDPSAVLAPEATCTVEVEAAEFADRYAVVTFDPGGCSWEIHAEYELAEREPEG